MDVTGDMIRGVILDFDGLVLDTETPMRTSWMEIYEEAGLHVMLGSSADPPKAYELLEAHLGRGIDREALHEKRLRREVELLADEDVLPGVRKVIAEARDGGLLLAIASSSERAWVRSHLASRGLLESFDALACAEDVEETKPAPDLYLHALSALGLRPTEVLVFEDSEHGVAAAKAAGLYCIAVPNAVTRCLPFTDADLVVEAISGRSLREYVDLAEGQAVE
jgi:HAD superfamily hydrolase (TIGR01509 family)